MTNNTTSKSAQTDIIENQRQLIEDLKVDREMQARIVAGLQQKNEQLLRELNQVTQELRGIKTAVLQNPGNPQLAIEMSHAGIQYANEIQRREHEASNQRKAFEREEALAKQLEQDKQAVFNKYPNMVTRLEKGLASERQKIQDRIRGLERFYSLDKNELSDFLSGKHTDFESPCQYVLSNDEYEDSRGKTQRYYWCDICGSQFRWNVLADAERHCHNYNPDKHKEAALEEISRLERVAMTEARSQYEHDIREMAAGLKKREYTETVKREHEESKRRQQKLEREILAPEDTLESISIKIPKQETESTTGKREKLRPWPPNL